MYVPNPCPYLQLPVQYRMTLHDNSVSRASCDGEGKNLLCRKLLLNRRPSHHRRASFRWCSFYHTSFSWHRSFGKSDILSPLSLLLCYKLGQLPVQILLAQNHGSHLREFLEVWDRAVLKMECSPYKIKILPRTHIGHSSSSGGTSKKPRTVSGALPS